MNITSTDRRPRPSKPGLVLFALAFSGMCASFMQTLLVPIQGKLPELLDAPLAVTVWVIIITQLVSTIWMPIAGRLGDMFGKRRVLLAMLILLIGGSILAALAGNVWVLLIARAIQGAGFGVVVTGISLLRDEMPAERLGTAVAVVSATLGVGGAIGMPLAAYVAERFHWQFIFWVAAALSALAMLSVLCWVPASDLRDGGPVDWLGMLGFTVGTTALLLLISNGSAWRPLTIVSVSLLAVTVYSVWARHELRTETPLVDLRVNARVQVLMTNLTGVTMGFALFTPQVAFPQILTLPDEFGGLSLSLVTASLIIMPQGLAMLAMSPVAGRLQRRWRTKYLVTLGSLLMATGYVLVLFGPNEIWVFLVAGSIIGSGTGLGYAAMPSLIMSSVPVSETGSANGVNALARSLGTAFAASIAGGLLAASSVTIDGVTAPPVRSFDAIFLIAICAAVACALFAMLIPQSRRYPS